MKCLPLKVKSVNKQSRTEAKRTDTSKMADKAGKPKHVRKGAKEENENIAISADKQKEFTEKIGKIKVNDAMKCGTMYIGHIPHGFYEDQMHAYFSQFGTVNKVRLARSKKTGGYKGYGYIQFASDEVAKIAADTMNNYLMFDKLLKCQFVEESKLHPQLWKGANKKFVWVNRRLKERTKYNKVMPRSKEQLKATASKLIKKDNRRRKMLSALGIQYEFPGYAAAIATKKVKRVSVKGKRTSSLKEKTPRKKSMSK